MHRFSTILGVVLVFALGVIVADIGVQVWLRAFAGDDGAASLRWVRYLVDPALAAIIACGWVLFTAGRRSGERDARRNPTRD